MIKRMVWVVLASFVIIACNRSHKLESNMDSIPFTIVCHNLIHKPLAGVDSQIGTIICDGIVLSYDYGLYSNNGPLTLDESFEKSFYAYHYSKFFDAIFIDEKLRESFKDSVKIIKVEEGISKDKYIVNCRNCNATAHLLFNETIFYYPFTFNKDNASNRTKYEIVFERMSGYFKKTYMSKQLGSSGIYIAPLGNPRRNRRSRSKQLSVTTSHNPDTNLNNIFASIQLK